MSDDDWIIENDEAWTPEDLAALARLRARQRLYREKHREQRAAYNKAYREAHREQINAYNKLWMARRRGKGRVLLASLHSLRCTGPERPACRCRKVRMYSAVPA